MRDYHEFLNHKKIINIPSGIKISPDKINPLAFDFERDIVLWALQKGKAAIFAGTGLGKTFQMLEWARHIHLYTNKPVLILTPLSVANQTVREGNKFGIEVNHCKDQSGVINGINVTNYEKLDHFNTDAFAGVVLDESSILKSFTGKIKTKIFDAFKNTPYKLACTATPSPNDYMELANHAEFLGVMTRSEFLSMWFIHDSGDTAKWRLKGHAKEEYWRWVAGWAVMMQNPADLGYDGSRFDLPKLHTIQHTVATGNEQVKTLTDLRNASRLTLKERVQMCADIANGIDESFIIWCNLNDEGDALTKAVNGAVQIKGSDTPEYKERVLAEFANGTIKKLVSKASITGFGLNWQHCHNMAFVGLSHSFEQYYQAVRRCWRFGQQEEVNVHVITSDMEGAVVANIERKEKDFNNMLSNMISVTQELTKKNITQTARIIDEYKPTKQIAIPLWLRSMSA